MPAVLQEDNRILGTDHIKAYLFTSIRHRCLNYLDHLKIRNEYQEKILQKRDITGMLTWEYYVEAELRQHIETAIDHLPPQARKTPGSSFKKSEERIERLFTNDSFTLVISLNLFLYFYLSG